MYNIKLEDYVPKPNPATSDRIVAAHYYAAWKKGAAEIHGGFDDLSEEYPDRTPLMGYYDEENPEVADWEIKWAVEHGINCFIHCWYRKPDNYGKKVTLNDLRCGHGLHEALFNAKYQKYMKFAIMYEASTEFTGMSPRVMSNVMILDELFRFIPNVTFVFFSPRNKDITFSLEMDTPATLFPSTDTIRSPARRPTFSLGPPEITSMIEIVSFIIENEIPIPLNEPSNSSLVAWRSFAEIYDEWGSNWAMMSGNDFSNMLSIFIVSTYFSVIKSKIWPSFLLFPLKLLVVNILPIHIPNIKTSEIIMGRYSFDLCCIVVDVLYSRFSM